MGFWKIHINSTIMQQKRKACFYHASCTLRNVFSFFANRLLIIYGKYLKLKQKYTLELEKYSCMCIFICKYMSIYMQAKNYNFIFYANETVFYL